MCLGVVLILSDGRSVLAKGSRYSSLAGKHMRQEEDTDIKAVLAALGIVLFVVVNLIWLADWVIWKVFRYLF